ncbi:hypothetical protein SAMN06265222_11343 [Neorhodopirellula lusitana]|uniref:EamA domain-containing protein n=1 Tax=Neorhodopirellula lusitana TaxID=445327 RepID=A0ABY1QH25_9BACT|nr:hypothetical protein [Neorhodopirellula lusitana]SMP70427.1 hypothetical protein SAMN06265222_11343 [Neorhodopirellula lusitana]
MISSGTFWCSLAAAIIYTIGLLFLKRSTLWNPGPWRMTLLTNAITALVFAPMLLWGKPINDFTMLWQPLVVALCFVIGQIFVVLAVTQGDVSIATPVLGLKILFVAGQLLLFAGQVPSAWIWPAGVLAVLAVACLSYQGGDRLVSSREHRTSFWGGRVGLTTTYALIAAFAYAGLDSMVQLWSPAFSVQTFMPVAMIFAAVISLAMIPVLEGRYRDIPRPAWPWLVTGGFLTGLQAVFLSYAIGTWGQAAGANVVYSSRGLWSVVAVVTVGSYFSKTEFTAPRSVKAMRLIGAALITLAIAMLL